MAKKVNDKEKNVPENKGEGKVPVQGGHPSLPYILDFAFSISNLLILLTGVATTAVSFVKGVTILNSVIRGGLAMLGLGAVIWLLNYYLSNQVLETAAKDLQNAHNPGQSKESTMEKQA